MNRVRSQTRMILNPLLSSSLDFHPVFVAWLNPGQTVRNSAGIPILTFFRPLLQNREPNGILHLQKCFLP